MPLLLVRAKNYLFALIIPLSDWENLKDTQLQYAFIFYRLFSCILSRSFSNIY